MTMQRLVDRLPTRPSEHKGCFKPIDPRNYQSEKPYYYTGTLPDEQESSRTNLQYLPVRDIPIVDLRPVQAQLDIHHHGVEFLPVPDCMSDEALMTKGIDSYMRAAATLLKSRFKADTVLIYDYRYRESKSQQQLKAGIPTGSASVPDEPANSPHVDATKDGGLRRARRHMTEEERSRYLDGPTEWRVRIVNLWRPLDKPVRHAPLAFCDYFTVEKLDLVAADRVNPVYVGEVYYLSHSDRHRWFFLEHQSPGEMAHFISFDSNPVQNPAFCPHASFQVEDDSNDLNLGRRSLEVRAIVVTEH